MGLQVEAVRPSPREVATGASKPRTKQGSPSPGRHRRTQRRPSRAATRLRSEVAGAGSGTRPPAQAPAPAYRSGARRLLTLGATGTSVWSHAATGSRPRRPCPATVAGAPPWQGQKPTSAASKVHEPNNLLEHVVEVRPLDHPAARHRSGAPRCGPCCRRASVRAAARGGCARGGGAAGRGLGRRPLGVLQRHPEHGRLRSSESSSTRWTRGSPAYDAWTRRVSSIGSSSGWCGCRRAAPAADEGDHEVGQGAAEDRVDRRDHRVVGRPVVPSTTSR